MMMDSIFESANSIFEGAKSVLPYLNAMVCFLIMIRLMIFRRNGSRFRRGVAWVAYGIILASGFIAFSTWLNYYTSVHPAEVILNITICVAIWRANGNIARIAVRN